MKIFEIWSEGYIIQGNKSTAIYFGREKAETFKEACDNFAKITPNFAEYYNPKKMTFWGCRLFDNETDARKSFG